MRRIALSVAALALALGTVAGPARASGTMLAERGSAAPVALRIAASSDGARTTRWQSIVLPAGQRVAWLVPVRPGADVDFAGEAFFAALEETTAVKVERPRGGSSACGLEGTLETVWSDLPTDRAPLDTTPTTYLADEDALDRYATAAGFVVPPGTAARAFRDGFSLLALSFAPRARPAATPIVRVTDDGPLSLPIVLADGAPADVAVTAFTIAEGPIQVGNRAVVGPVVWGVNGSTYREERAAALVATRGFGYVTEAAGHDLVFGPRPLLPNGVAPAPLVASYAARVAPSPQKATSCAADFSRMASHPVAFGIACPRGALATIGEGSKCVAAPGATDPMLAACGSDEDDLAIAFSGKNVGRVSVTRAAGLVLAGSNGSFVATSAGEDREPVVVATLAAECGGGKMVDPRGPSSSDPPLRGPGPAASSSDEARYYETGCSGGTYIDTSSASSYPSSSSDESCDSSSTSDSSSEETGCGGDTVGGDNDGSSDACSSDSSDSSDSCDSGSGDACDSPDAQNRKGNRGKSPMSRAAFVLVALALPLRRARRAEKGDRA